MSVNVSIIGETEHGVAVCAAAIRCSTGQGTITEFMDEALRLDQASGPDGTKNAKLITRVVSSGHMSVLEHYCFTLAFNNVSVMVEQFMIEFRLASFLVKSRRYVDFSEMGYYIPEDLTGELLQIYKTQMDKIFTAYKQLTDIGVPKEDARFVLPYCFYSNFSCTCNARELLHIICTMIYGRGKAFDELRNIGLTLADEFEKRFPGIIERERIYYERETPVVIPSDIGDVVNFVNASADILSFTPDAHRFIGSDPSVLKALVSEPRPRHLELLNAVLEIKNISLAGLTHLVRHRMQSIVVPHITSVFYTNNFLLPASIVKHDAEGIYRETIVESLRTLRDLLRRGMRPEHSVYFALSGAMLDIITNMNARELLHFLRLRTCTRAQWEIRAIATEMLTKLQPYSDVFAYYGPSCKVLGYCPEGKFSCGLYKTFTKKR